MIVARTPWMRRRSDWATALLAVLAAAGVALFLLLFVGLEARMAPMPAQALVVRDARTCAAVRVYRLATADDWGQRAAIARTALNAPAPDCGAGLVEIMRAGLDELRWLAALDAVDAVQSGSYALPLQCHGATTVVPARAPAALATQCVIGDLAFVAEAS